MKYLGESEANKPIYYDLLKTHTSSPKTLIFSRPPRIFYRDEHDLSGTDTYDYPVSDETTAVIARAI